MKQQFTITVLVLAVLLTPAFGSAVSDVAPAQLSIPAKPLDCAPCHQNPNMTPSLQDAVGVPKSLYIDPTAFEQSWHYKVGKKTQCVLCHEDVKTYPHQRVKHLTCSNCHPEDKKPEFKLIEENIRQSVHNKLDCNDCHDPHANKPAVAMTLAEKNHGCLKCHENGRTPGADTIIEPVSIVSYHSWHPQAALHIDRMACIVCHTNLGKGGTADKHLILDKSHATRDCATCHSGDSKVVSYLIDVGPGAKENMSRASLLERIYLIGGTRNKYVETGGNLMLLFTILGIFGHGMGRVIMSRRKRR